MYVLRKLCIFLGHLFKSSGQPHVQSGLMEVGQGNAKIHLFDRFFLFGEFRFVVRINQDQVFKFIIRRPAVQTPYWGWKPAGKCPLP